MILTKALEAPLVDVVVSNVNVAAAPGFTSNDHGVSTDSIDEFLIKLVKILEVGATVAVGTMGVDVGAKVAVGIIGVAVGIKVAVGATGVTVGAVVFVGTTVLVGVTLMAPFFQTRI